VPLAVASFEVIETVPQPSLAVGVENVGVFGQSIVEGPPAVIVGAVLSITEIVCEAVAIFPHASVAVHVLVTEYALGHVITFSTFPIKLISPELILLPDVVASLNVSDDVPQASLAVGVENDGEAGQLMIAFAPTPLINGAVLSITEIVCEAVAVLPHASVAVHFLVTE
jgi:ABC-type phosphate transport system permease subunit